MADAAPLLLLSMPQMADPNFARSVVLLCEYTDEGAFGLVVNRPMEQPAWTLIRTDPPITVNPAIFGARYLIVTHPNFLAAANTLKAHKQALGISTRVVTTSEITGASPTATRTQIRNWIANFYNTHLVRPKWVLFVGDAEFIPTNYDEISPFVSDPSSPEYARTAGDMWYGQFAPGADAFTVPPFGIGST